MAERHGTGWRSRLLSKLICENAVELVVVFGVLTFLNRDKYYGRLVARDSSLRLPAVRRKQNH